RRGERSRGEHACTIIECFRARSTSIFYSNCPPRRASWSYCAWLCKVHFQSEHTNTAANNARFVYFLLKVIPSAYYQRYFQHGLKTYSCCVLLTQSAMIAR
ncbi:hypothetical protein Tcan_00857, partial [Toxocara canis]